MVRSWLFLFSSQTVVLRPTQYLPRIYYTYDHHHLPFHSIRRSLSRVARCPRCSIWRCSLHPIHSVNPIHSTRSISLPFRLSIDISRPLSVHFWVLCKAALNRPSTKAVRAAFPSVVPEFTQEFPPSRSPFCSSCHIAGKYTTCQSLKVSIITP
jgi:hypothetical protein